MEWPRRHGFPRVATTERCNLHATPVLAMLNIRWNIKTVARRKGVRLCHPVFANERCGDTRKGTLGIQAMSVMATISRRKFLAQMTAGLIAMDCSELAGQSSAAQKDAEGDGDGKHADCPTELV